VIVTPSTIASLIENSTSLKTKRLTIQARLFFDDLPQTTLTTYLDELPVAELTQKSLITILKSRLQIPEWNVFQFCVKWAKSIVEQEKQTKTKKLTSKKRKTTTTVVVPNDHDMLKEILAGVSYYVRFSQIERKILFDIRALDLISDSCILDALQWKRNPYLPTRNCWNPLPRTSLTLKFGVLFNSEEETISNKISAFGATWHIALTSTCISVYCTLGMAKEIATKFSVLLQDYEPYEEETQVWNSQYSRRAWEQGEDPAFEFDSELVEVDLVFSETPITKY